MKKTILFAAILAAFAMVSCTKERIENENGEQKAIVLGSSVASIETRGPIGADFTDLEATVVAYTDDVTDPKFIQNVEFAEANDVTVVTGKYYPADGSSVNFVGYAPIDGVLYAGVVTFTIDGTQDVMYAGEVSGSKISTTAPNLNFVHNLTQLQFTVKAEDAAAATEWGSISKIEVLNQNTVFEVTLEDNTIGNISIPANLIVDDSDVDFATDVTAVVPAGNIMVLPLSNLDATSLEIKVYTEEVPNGQVISLSSIAGVAATDAGSAYTINLTFKAKEIELTGTVTDWVNGGASTDVDIL